MFKSYFLLLHQTVRSAARRADRAAEGAGAEGSGRAGGEEEGTYIRQTDQRPNRNLASDSNASLSPPFITKNAQPCSGYCTLDATATASC